MIASLSSFLNSQHFWLIQIILIFGGFYLLNRLLTHLIRKAQQRSMEKKSEMVELLHSTLFPGRVLLGIVLVSYGFRTIAERFPAFVIIPFVAPLAKIGILFCICWWLFRWKSWFFKLLSIRLDKSSLPFDFTLLEISGKILNIVIIYFGIVQAFQIVGLDTVPLVTLGSIGTAALGFAAQDTIANFVSGFMLYATRPFVVGDLIEIPDKGIRGHIEEIGWCLTSIKDLHKKPFFIPNRLFSSTILINISRMSRRCFHETISVRYNDISKIPHLLEGIQNIFKKHPKIDQKLPIFVFFDSFGSYSLIIQTRAYVMTSLYEIFMKVKQEILIQIFELIKEHSAEIAYPTSLMKMQKVDIDQK